VEKTDIGIVGMGVMGQNLALNIEGKGFTVSVYNRTEAKTKGFVQKRAKGKTIIPTYSLEDFAGSLKKPRKILLMVKAGGAIDDFIDKLVPLLEKKDIVIDGGNSYFKDTERRYERMKREGIFYIGAGISGGEYGALHGPCIMPGGDEEAYKQVEEIFTKTCAYTEDGPCCSYLGLRSAGHFVKTVHNGIEYALMQILAESYHLMREGLSMDVEDIQRVFDEWNRGELNSYLVEITAEILKRKDEITRKPVVDVILDKAEQKGTGKWTSQVALDLGVPVPSITEAVNARVVSSFKEDRVRLSTRLKASLINEDVGIEKEEFLFNLADACYTCMLLSYTQGLHLLKVASDEFDYKLNLGEVARIWKGGCIIRAKALDLIKSIYEKHKDLSNLLLAEEFESIFNHRLFGLRQILIQAKKWGISTSTMSACLNYYDSYRKGHLPANLIQAQRDYFGAHTYERVDRKGTFHTQWQKMD